MLELSTVLALTQLGIRQSDWWRAGIRSTNLHIVVEYPVNSCCPGALFTNIDYAGMGAWGHGQVITCHSFLCDVISCLNTLRLRQNGRLLADNTFKCIFLNENVLILIGISLKYVPWGQIDNKPALVQIMAWCQTGHKPLMII